MITLLLRLKCLPVFALLLAGCNVIGFGAAMFPDPRRAPEYTLAPVATYVEVHADASRLGDEAELFTDPVAIALRRELARGNVPLTDRRTEARQIVSVEVRGLDAETYLGSDVRRDAASARVRVLDDAGTQIWPADGTPGRLVATRSPVARTRDPVAGSDARDRQLRHAALARLGRAAAAPFFPQTIGDLE